MNCYKFTIYQYVPRLASLWTASVSTLIFFLFIMERNDWAYIKTNVCFMRWKRKQSSNSTWKISLNCVQVVTHITSNNHRSTGIGIRSEILACFPPSIYRKKLNICPRQGTRPFISACFKKTWHVYRKLS